MLQELSHMDRITQLQDEIQQLLTIMSRTIAYLTSRSNFLQVSLEIPVTKQRNPDRFDTPEVFEANKKELVTDLIVKAKQIEYLIKSLPEPEPEEEQVRPGIRGHSLHTHFPGIGQRLQALQDDMTSANADYIRAVDRAKDLHTQISDMLRTMLTDTNANLIVHTPG
ncbi:hypothetical protein BD779DRAFT_663622 [Infundibulicybe gibba]|nr:hypothetical protein BD779DRAFT_663622 [Infundibulicybe gibba]